MSVVLAEAGRISFRATPPTLGFDHHTFQTSMILHLAYEIIDKIVSTAVADLVEQERHDDTVTGQTNTFLLSAALVSHTWKVIAQSSLLRNGLVDPSQSQNYLSALARAGCTELITAVRVGVTGGGALRPGERSKSSKELTELIECVPNLASLEVVGERLELAANSLAPGECSHGNRIGGATLRRSWPKEYAT